MTAILPSIRIIVWPRPDRGARASRSPIGSRLNLLDFDLWTHQILIRLTPSDQAVCRAVHHHLGGTRAGVVVRRHRHAVGTGTERRQQVALLHIWQVTPLG